ncbi:MAG: hypothetical protein P0Y59_14355 [Candidatus Sphingomonas phytovorans]|nr:hypothetical protein [Sphingomonas sp.]WEJ98126.1 MAG: hypothetical protein P0Y59_14355 [Sphingomonas sp.]
MFELMVADPEGFAQQEFDATHLHSGPAGFKPGKRGIDIENRRRWHRSGSLRDGRAMPRRWRLE